MYRLFLLSVAVVTTSLGLHAATPTPTTAPAKKTEIHVRVDAPLSAHAFYQDDIADAFLTALQNQAHWTKYAHVFTEDDLGEGPYPRLTINLIHWRTDFSGDIVCRGTATFETKEGSWVSLGSFEGRTPGIMRSGSRAFLGRDFERAAEEASREIMKAIDARSPAVVAQH